MLQNTVSNEEWLSARKDFMTREKKFTLLREELSEARRQLPKVKIEKDYRFQGLDGEVKLADLFDDCSQLVIYHFMFGIDWEEGCPSYPPRTNSLGTLPPNRYRT